MKTNSAQTPEAVMQKVTIEMIRRAIKLGKKNGRTIRISKTSGGKGVDVCDLNPDTAEGHAELEKFFTPVKRHYTFSGLGLPEERDAVNWRKLNFSFARRMLAGLTSLCTTS